MITREKHDLTGLESGAIFSDCLKYRYRLWRRWDAQLPKINFLMLNPSTADEAQNDPTVERCEQRVRRMGGGELIVTNLFAWRSTDPAELRLIDDPVGPANGTEILRAAKAADMVICAWGGKANFREKASVSKGRGRGVLTADLLRSIGIKLHCLRTTQAGDPEHPLYLPYSLKPQPF